MVFNAPRMDFACVGAFSTAFSAAFASTFAANFSSAFSATFSSTFSLPLEDLGVFGDFSADAIAARGDSLYPTTDCNALNMPTPAAVFAADADADALDADASNLDADALAADCAFSTTAAKGCFDRSLTGVDAGAGGDAGVGESSARRGAKPGVKTYRRTMSGNLDARRFGVGATASSFPDEGVGARADLPARTVDAASRLVSATSRASNAASRFPKPFSRASHADSRDFNLASASLISVSLSRARASLASTLASLFASAASRGANAPLALNSLAIVANFSSFACN